jgi:tape measure domain-containing protein
MTTITALNVRLGMDVSNFSEGANLAKGEVTKVASIMRQSVSPAEKYRQELDLLNRAFSDAGKKSKEYANAVDFLKKKHDAATASIQQTSNAIKNAGSVSTSAIASIKGMAAAYLGVQTIAKSLNLAGQVEDATIAFEVLTGSVNDGKVLFEQIRQLDKNTPITFGNATQAAKTMLSFGVQVQDVAKNLQMLSDVTGGNNDRFKMLALAFSQMSAAGRLMGQDVLQMINAGFNPLQQISKTTGESLIDLKKRMEDGAISSQEVRKAFEDATSAGGMFHGMTDRLAQTVSGKMNIALSEFEKKLGEIGASLGPLVSQLLDLFTQLQPWLEATARLIGRVAEGFGYMLARIRDIMSSIINFTWDETETNKFLDGWEKRQREQAEAARQQIKTEFEQRKAAVNEVAIAEQKAQQEIAAAKKKSVEEQEKAAKAAAKDEEKRIKDLEKERLKAIETERKERERAAKQAEEQFARDLDEARKGAMEFFKKQEEKNQKRREDIAAGPGAGIELGSAEAVKFSADRINKAMAEGVIPEQQETPWGDLGEKTAQLFKEQQIANQINREQTQILFSILTESKENGFRRIR